MLPTVDLNNTEKLNVDVVINVTVTVTDVNTVLLTVPPVKNHQL